MVHDAVLEWTEGSRHLGIPVLSMGSKATVFLKKLKPLQNLYSIHSYSYSYLHFICIFIFRIIFIVIFLKKLVSARVRNREGPSWEQENTNVKDSCWVGNENIAGLAHLLMGFAPDERTKC